MTTTRHKICTDARRLIPALRVGFMIAASVPATLAYKGIAAEPSLPPSTPFVTRFVTPATITAGVIRPRRILERLPDGGESISLWAVEATRLSLFPREPARHLIRVIETCGSLLQEVDEIGCAVQYDKAAENFFSVFLLRFSRPIDPELVGDLFRQPQVKNIGDIKTFRQGPAFQAAALVDDRSLLICPAPVFDGLLATGAGGGPIHDAIASVARDSDMAMVFSPAGLPDGQARSTCVAKTTVFRSRRQARRTPVSPPTSVRC